MSRPKTTQSLTAKVAAILRTVKELERKGHNENGDYDYTRATDVFKAVRDRLFRAGIMLLPDEGDPIYVNVPTNGGGALTECRLPVTYTFTDGVDSLKPLRCNGIGRTTDEKALYIAQTGAEKAFLKRVGLMAEKIDDPEFDRHAEPAGETLDDVAPLRGPKVPKVVTERQISAFNEACANAGKTEQEKSEYLLQTHKVASIAELGRGKPFTQAIVWASDGKGTLEPPKPQAVPGQGTLPLRTAPQPIEMKIGNQTVAFEPKTNRTTFSV